MLWAAADAQSLKLPPRSFLPPLVPELWRWLWLSRDKPQSNVGGLETPCTCGPGAKSCVGPLSTKRATPVLGSCGHQCPWRSPSSLLLDTHECLIPFVKWLLCLLAQPAKMEMPSGCSGEVTLLCITTQKENDLCCQCLNKLLWGNCLLYETLRQESFPVLCFPW